MNDGTMTPPLDRLLAIMARLRDPEHGCPWDRDQDFATIAPYTIEEAYEVADAIARGDMRSLKEELGDLLLQVVFHSRMAEEAGLFAFDDVATAIADKMERRHPHVFGDARIATAAAQTEAWEAQKAAERRDHARDAGNAHSVLDGVALALPALLRAAKVQSRAARIGFDWPQARPVFDKLAEEIAELKAEFEASADAARLEDELGDVLFAAANLARKLDIDPEAALRHATAKFERRFRHVEALAAEQAVGADLDKLDALWNEVKREGRSEVGPISDGHSGDMRFPVSVKGVLIEDAGVVLLLNERDEWELPGGRLERGENPAACLEREFAEELGAEITVGEILDCWLYRPLPDKEVLIVTYAVRRLDQRELRVSREHRNFGVFALEALQALRLPEGYRRSILDCAARPRSASAGVADDADARCPPRSA